MYIGNQTKIMRKLLGKPPTVDTSNENTAGITSSPAVAAYRPNASQNAVYHAGVPIARIDASPDGKSAVLAGRHILKIVKIDGLTVKEGLDIRALITSQRAASASSASTADQLSIRDVKWAKGHEGKIFTACANGKIFRYDISRVGTATPGGTPLDTIQMAEDSRQVNTLDVNPHRGSFLLSGSQDGVVRLFDIREPVQTRRGPSFRTSQAFKCNAEGVRHVKWSPKEAFFFACGTEQGVVLKWDIRKAAAPLLRINAHEKTCTSVSWHPDGEHLISGGWDNKCHVWDMSRDKRQKPKYTISTPGLVADLAWRPGQWSATAQGKRAAQVAVTYDETSQKRFGINTVHIWDLARPTMPYKEIDRFDFSPSGILWHDQDLLWTVGQDGLFNQCDVAFAPKVLDRTSVSSMAFSARGEVLMFLDERPQARRPRLATLREAETVPSTPQNSSPTAPMLSVSRSDSEDDVVGSFLGPRKRPGRRRRPSVRSVHTLSTTPPTGPTSDDHVFSLEQTLKMTGQFKSQQAMAIGPVPSGAKPNVYQYLTMHYLETLKSGLPYVRDGPLMAERVAGIIEHYARAAENAGQFRLAQTWRILAFAVERLLSRRAQYHLERRMSRQKNQSPAWRAWKESQAQERPRLGSMVPIPEADDTPRKAHSSSSLLDKHAPLRSLLAEEFESTSNMPTPIARPVDNYAENRTRSDPVHLIGSHTDLPPVPESEDFNLPAAVHSQAIEPRKRLDSMPLSDTSFASDGTKISSTEGYDFYDMDTIVHAIDVPQTRRDPEVSDQIQPRSPSREKPLPLRHDSDESFAQLFSISQASGQSGQTSSSGSSLSRRITNPERIPVHRRSSASEAMDGEYQSRIRGKQLQNSPGSSQLLRRTLRRTSTSMTDTTDEDYRMITQTTSGSIPSQGFSSRYDEDFNSGVPQIEVADAESVAASLQDSGPIEDENSPFVIESDYYIWPSDPAFPYPTSNDKEVHKRRPVPLQPYTLISRALAFETRSSALNAAAIVLLLKPLVPNDVIDTFQAGGILRQHHSRLMGMKLFVEAALLRKLCVKGWPGGLLSDWGESYSAIFTLAQTGVSVGFLCSKCRKPRDIDRTSRSNDTVWVCDRCRGTMGPCAVCKHRDTTSNIFPLDQTPLHGGGGPHHPHSTDDRQEDLRNVLSTWWYCPGCGHGGHATCLEAWHSSAADGASGGSPLIGSGGTDPQHIPESGTGAEFSDGCCPLDGCGHPCLPGRWRTESAATRSEELTRSMREVARGGGAVVGAGAGGAASAPGGGFKGSPLGSVGGDRGAVGDRRVSGGSGMLPLGAGIRGDGNDVLQSRAVESVREVLGGDRDGMGGGSRGVAMGSSPGRGGGVGITGGVGVGEQRERERRKIVKFAGTEDRR